MSNEDPTKNLSADTLVILSRLDQIGSRLGKVETRLDGVEARLGKVETRLDEMDTRLTALEKKVDDRLHDTRPVWEAVQARLDKLEADVAAGFRNVEKRLDAMSVQFSKLYGDVFDHEGRITKLEQKPS